MKLHRALAWISLLGAGACSTPQSSNSTPATVTVAPAESATATAPVATATATAAAREPSCAGRRRIGNASFAPDGQSLATACAGRQVCDEASDGNDMVDVWSISQGKIQKSVQTGMSNVTSILWGAGGWLATAADPTTGMGAIRLYSTSTWDKKFEQDFYCISGLAFNPAGSTLAVAGCDGHLIGVSTATGKAVSRPEKEAHPGGDYSVSVAFSEDGKTLFVDDESEGYQELDPVTLKRRSTRHGPTPGPCAATSAKGDLYAASAEDGTLTVADVKSSKAGKPRTLAKEAGAACTWLLWVDATRFAVAFSNGGLALWDTTGKGSRRDLAAPAQGQDPVHITSLQLGAAGSVLVSGDSAGGLALWDIATGTRRDLWRPPAAKGPDQPAPQSPSLTWSPSGDRAAGQTGDHVTVWDAKTGSVLSEVAVIAKPDDETPRIVWSPNGNVMTIADGALRLVRFPDGAKLTLTTADYQGGRAGSVGAASGAFAGPPDLAHCVVPASVPADKRVQRQSLLSDFFAGKPL